MLLEAVGTKLLPAMISVVALLARFVVLEVIVGAATATVGKPPKVVPHPVEPDR